MMIAADKRRIFLRTLRAFYKKHGRSHLPWRKTHDPYKVMVSEIMLQQTQVDRVISYFNTFIKKYPTARSLAKAPLSDVLKAWSGLGYNRRAKMLHEAAKVIAKNDMPRTREGLEGLAGIGKYTAGAIRAFAFNEREIFIETNIRTVLIHHFFEDKAQVDDKELVGLLEQLVPEKDSRDFYAAMMDYGTHLKKQGIAVHQRSRQYKKQSAFKGSLREVRGAILKAKLAGKPLAPLKKQFPDRYAVALRSLKKEGLI